MFLQVQQLLTQVDQLTDDRDALDKQVILADVAASNALLLLLISFAVSHLS